MTNQMIIMMNQVELAKEGILDYTGRTIDVKMPDDSVMSFKEAEEIHTFQKWKSMGFQVQKGEKAVAQFMIWKHVLKKNKETDEDESKMFMKKASFFKRSQVKEIEK